MKSTYFFALMLLALFTTSCDKQEPAITHEEQERGLPAELAEQDRLIRERIANAVDTEAEIRKINEEHGRYVDEKGDVYFSKEAFEEITEIRNNPQKRAQTVYNSWYNPNNDAAGTVWYWDNGSYHYLASLQSGEVFVTCPSGFTLCSDYNQYLCSFAKLNTPNCSSNCCRDLYGRCWVGTTIKDQDRFSYEIEDPGVPDWWEARIMNKLVTTPPLLPNRGYVLNGTGCGYGYGGCQGGGSCPGPLCGYFD